MPALDAISQALDSAAAERLRLERGAAALVERTAARLAEVDEAIAGVRQAHERIVAAIEDERARLAHLEVEASRLDLDADAAAREAERVTRHIEAQERVVRALDADRVRSRELSVADAMTREQERTRREAERAARDARLEQARAEIARCSAERAVSLARLEAAPPSETERDLAEIARRRAHLDDAIAVERERRDATRSAGAPSTLAERIWQERGQRIDEEIGRLQIERTALEAAEALVHREAGEHAERLDALRRDVAAADGRLAAAHDRFAHLERSIRDAEDGEMRADAAADAMTAKRASAVRDLELALAAERDRLEALRRELGELERARRVSVERARSLRREVAAEHALRELMADQASLEVALERAVAEREPLERLVERMRGGAAVT